jgi:hypothetical protein
LPIENLLSKIYEKEAKRLDVNRANIKITLINVRKCISFLDLKWNQEYEGFDSTSKLFALS